MPTPFGPVGVGDAGCGLCGGMAYAAADLFLGGRPPPDRLTPPVFRYLCRRLLDSFDFPFGFLRYLAWQWRPDATRRLSGVPVLNGVSRLTVEVEWPKVRAALDAGQPAPLGLVRVRSFSLNPWVLGRNHQVLAYGYDLDEPGGSVRIRVYDPNHSGDDEVRLEFDTREPDAGRPVVHNREGPNVRGFFLTEYRSPVMLPDLGSGDARECGSAEK